MKTLDECFEEAENKYSRKGISPIPYNVDSLYPILRTIAKEGFKNWLAEQRQTTGADDSPRLYDYWLNNLIAKLEAEGQ